MHNNRLIGRISSDGWPWKVGWDVTERKLEKVFLSKKSASANQRWFALGRIGDEVLSIDQIGRIHLKLCERRWLTKD